MSARILIAFLAGVGLLLAGCAARGSVDTPSAETGMPDASGAGGSSGGSAAPAAQYLSKVDGLHVTGTAVNVDIASFRLRIGGRVESPFELGFDEIRTLESTRLEAQLACPGFFVDEGFWTGVPVRTLLERAGVETGARRVSFTSVDGSYTQSLPLDKALDPRMLVAYEFDDRAFPVVHGFPLRLVAPGEPGSVWVKWLGSITVE